MSATVTLSPSGHRFVVEQGETILEAALRSGLSPGHGCANGSCGECKARVVTGEVSQVRFHDFAIPEAEKRVGHILLCSTTATGDVTIEAVEATSPEDIPVQKVRARVQSPEKVAHGLMVLGVKVQRGRILRFLAGQHVRLALGGLPPREVPVASCHCDGLNLQFHLREFPDDAFSRRVFAGLKTSDKLDIEGPWGDFVLRTDSPRAMVFIAYDTAFAPVKSLIEHAINLELDQPLHLIRLSPDPEAPYLHNYCRSWADALDNLTYRTVTGVAAGEPGSLDGIVDELENLSDFDAYVAGPPAMTANAKAVLEANGLPADRLFVDTV